jgi:hypothetical protein
MTCRRCLDSGWLLSESRPCACRHGEALAELYADFTAAEMEVVREIRRAAARSGLFAAIRRVVNAGMVS